MPLPQDTLSSLQAAGAAIFAADTELKKSVADYSEQVKLAMLENPFDVSNDNLFENWKTVARLAQAVAHIEAEFKKIYIAAAELSPASRPVRGAVRALAAPSPSTASAVEVVKEVQATDVVAKKTRKKRKLTRASAKAKATAKAGGKKSNKPLRGNNAKLIAHLMETLSPIEGRKVNWSAVAVTTGIPKGSVGAARIKLLQTGHISEDPAGGFRLSAPEIQ